MRATGNRDGAVLTVDGLKRDFGSREIVRSLTLHLEPGMRAALSGPNGSGKTTVLRCIAGTLLPTEGRIQIAGRAPGTMAARHAVGVSMSQDRSFYLRISGRANLLFYARLRRGSSRQAARDVAEVVDELELGDIAAERADRCSTGMVQQLSLARALLGSPALLLLDEPTRSLDKEARERLWAAIDRRIRLAVVIASHLEEDLGRCGVRVDFPT